MEPVEPQVLGENGNSETFSPTKRVSQKYIYDFVCNNYTEEIHGAMILLLSENCKKWVMAREVGEQGTPHLQGYMNLKKKKRITELSVLFPFPISYRECRNEEALIAYCKKDGNFVSGGFPAEIKIIRELRPWQAEIEQIALSEPDGRTVHWYWESIGNIGKSAFCKYMVVKHKALVVRGGKLGDIMNIVFNNDMDACRCILFDIPRGTGGNVSYTSLEAILDGLITNTKYETGCKVFNPPHVICFANFPPHNTSALSEDRWKIKKIEQMSLLP